MTDGAVLDHYFAPLEPLLTEPEVRELVINRPGEIAVEGREGWRWFSDPRLTEDWLHTFAVAAAAHTHQDIGGERPLCSTVLPGDLRCQLVAPPVATRGLSVTLRKPSHRAFDLAALAEQGLFDEARGSRDRTADPVDEDLARLSGARAWPDFFRRAVLGRRNILISGATGSGKTTFAKALVALIPEEERLVTIEDTRELTAPHRNRVHLVYPRDGQGLAKVGPHELLECALRMRPDRILLQELRDGSAFLYLRSVNSGHPGSITTIHADSAALAFEQLTLLVRESEGGRDLPRDDIRALLHLLIDIVVQIKRDGDRFRITEVWHEPALKRRAGA